MTRDTSNLKRGGISPEAQKKGLEAMQRVKRTNKELEQLAAAGDTGAALELVFPELALHLNELVRAERREKGKPSREVTDRMGELRQLIKQLDDYRDRRGADELAGSFFAKLEERMSMMNLSEESPEQPEAR